MDAKRKILIIDDSQETVAGLKGFLDGKYDIVTAHDGSEGLQMYENETDGIDLIITDLVMPSFSGVSLIGVIKQKYPKIPIIAMTGWGHHPKALASEAKADLVLDKPFEMEELDRAIKRLLA